MSFSGFLTFSSYSTQLSRLSWAFLIFFDKPKSISFTFFKSQTDTLVKCVRIFVK